MGQSIRFFYTFLIIAGLCGCASTNDRTACDQKDWYELGRRDGSQGLPIDQIHQLRRDCGAKGRASWEAVYTNGRNAGLVEYCDPENAFEMGKMGISYMNVCPATIEPEFLRSYRRGQMARDLEVEIKTIDKQIQSVSQKIETEGISGQNRPLMSQLEQLRVLREKNARELERILN